MLHFLFFQQISEKVPTVHIIGTLEYFLLELSKEMIINFVTKKVNVQIY